MHPQPAFHRYVRLAGLLILAAGLAYGLATWAGLRATRPDHGGGQFIALQFAVGADAQGTPIWPYAAVDPALVPALQGGYDRPDLGASRRLNLTDLPPIGVYLPATGDTQLSLGTPVPPTPPVTRKPTPSLIPASATPKLTTSPLPSLTPSPAPPATFTPGPVYDGTLLPPGYGGPGCAPSGWPAAGILTQYYHWYHRGIDLGMPLNTPIVATHSARVLFAGWRTDGYGNLIILENGPFITYYAHLTDFNVVEGQFVARGNVIGWSGSTGYSTGPHVHYEIRIDDVEVDPLTFENRGYPSC